MLRTCALLRIGSSAVTGAPPLAAAVRAAHWSSHSLRTNAAALSPMNAGGGGFRLAHSDSVPSKQRQSDAADGSAACVRSRGGGADSKQRREANGRKPPQQRGPGVNVGSSHTNGDAPPNSEPTKSHPSSNREVRHRQSIQRLHRNQPQSNRQSADSHAHSPHIAKLIDQLHRLQDKYMRIFPSKNQALRKGTDDVTSKSEWTAMRQEAKQLLDRLLPLAAGGEYHIQWRDWKGMLHAMKDFRMHDMALPFFAVIRRQHDPLVKQWRAEQQLKQQQQPLSPSSADSAASSAAVPLSLPSELRMPVKCSAMLLECVAQCATVAECMAAIPTDLQSAVSKLFHIQPPLPPDARGAELAERLLREMRLPEMVDRFESDAGLWAVVLQGFAQLVDRHDTQRRREQIARVRSFYDSIPQPMRDDFIHSIMLAAYRRAGMREEGDALHQQLQTDSATIAGPRIINARLGDIYKKLSSHQLNDPVPLLAEAEQLWRQAKQRPLQSLDCATTMSMMKLYHYRGDLERQQSLLIEALQLERSAAVQATSDGDPRWTVDRDGPPVFVDAGCFCLLFNSFTHSERPASHAAAAKAAYALMRQRRNEAVRRDWKKRELQLIVTEAATNAYLKFLQRAGLVDEMLQLWEDMSATEKEGNPRALVAVLNAMSSVKGSHPLAERLMETVGAKVRLDAQLVTAWLGCYELSGQWRGAEALWQRMLERNIVPSSHSYRNLMQIYMTAAQTGSAEHLAKVELLYAEMRSGSGPAGKQLAMSVIDYEKLIKRAHRCDLPAEVLKWADRAKELSAWNQLDAPSQHIVAQCRREARE